MNIYQKIDESIQMSHKLFPQNMKADRAISVPSETWSTIEALTKITREAFPEHDSLDKKECAKLNHAIISLWKAYHLDIDFPVEKVDPHKLYQLLLNKWLLPVPIMKSGQWLLEFCSFDHDKCSIPDCCNFCNEDVIKTMDN